MHCSLECPVVLLPATEVGEAAEEPQTTVTTIRQLYPGAVGPQHLLGKQVLAIVALLSIRFLRSRVMYGYFPSASHSQAASEATWC